jgi:hypothetical protein
MPIELWIVLWKAVFVLGVGLFAVMAVVVTIGGALDIASLVRTLRSQHVGDQCLPSDDDAPSRAE